MKKFRKFSGQLFLSYGLWYGLERMIVEGMRTDSLFIGNTGIRVSQALSFGIVLVCGTLLVIKLIKYTKNPQPIEGVDFYPPMSEKEWAAHERKVARRQKAKAKRRELLAKMKLCKENSDVSDN